VAASVRQRLTNLARETGRPFAEVLQYFVMERFLYRLSRSPHADKFVLKGALMLTVWKAPQTRPTMDIDLLGRTSNSPDSIVAIVQDVCRQEVEPDGLRFDADQVVARQITEDADYHGVRVSFRGYLGTARIPMQIDVGFGDVVSPPPSSTSYPTLLEFPAPQLLGYSRETAIAEKFEAIVSLGQLNSRMKDFYDLWVLCQQFEFKGEVLAEAIAGTFKNRGTGILSLPVALTSAFANDRTKNLQWQAFLRKSRLTDAPRDLAPVVAVLAEFLLPTADALAAERPFSQQWSPPGPWVA
jgi:predicted nucleotidyltransferase component of viral defense system